MINIMDVHACMHAGCCRNIPIQWWHRLPCFSCLPASLVQMHQEKADDANEKLSAVSDLHNKAENLKIKQQTLAKQNGEAYARFLVWTSIATMFCSARRRIQLCNSELSH
jgi:hypothetical protein